MSEHCFHPNLDRPLRHIAGGNAVVSLIFAEYLNRLFWHATKADISPDDIPEWAIKLTAVGAVVGVTILGVATKTLGTRAAVVLTVIKVRFLFAYV